MSTPAIHVAYSLEMVSESVCCCNLSFSGPELAVLANALWEHLAEKCIHVHVSVLALTCICTEYQTEIHDCIIIILTWDFSSSQLFSLVSSDGSFQLLVPPGEGSPSKWASGTEQDMKLVMHNIIILCTVRVHVSCHRS